MVAHNSYATYFGAKYPAVSDVLDTAPTYGDAINVYNGTYDPGGGGTIPSAVDVRAGTAVGQTVGTLAVPTPTRVINGVATDNTTGSFVYPTTAQVQDGVFYGHASEFEGTYDPGIVPAVTDVRLGVPVGAGTGTLRVPDQDDVRLSVQYGAGSTEYTGLLDLPPANAVLLGVEFDNTTQTGTMRLPTQEKVELNYVYGPDDTLTGSLDPAGSPDYPAPSDVRDAISYSNGDLTGSLVVPLPADVRQGTVYDGLGVSQTGVLDLPSVDDVRLTVQFDSTTKTGTVRVPPNTNVLKDYAYDANDSVIGLLETQGGACFGYPDETVVLFGTVYGQSGELTGNRKDALESDVRIGQMYGAQGISLTGTYDCNTGTPNDTEWIGK